MSYPTSPSERVRANTAKLEAQYSEERKEAEKKRIEEWEQGYREYMNDNKDEMADHSDQQGWDIETKEE